MVENVEFLMPKKRLFIYLYVESDSSIMVTCFGMNSEGNSCGLFHGGPEESHKNPHTC